MASLVQRNQKGVLEPVEPFPVEEEPAPQLPAAGPQSAAEEFLDTLVPTKYSVPVVRQGLTSSVALEEVQDVKIYYNF